MGMSRLELSEATFPSLLELKLQWQTSTQRARALFWLESAFAAPGSTLSCRLQIPPGAIMPPPPPGCPTFCLIAGCTEGVPPPTWDKKATHLWLECSLRCASNSLFICTYIQKLTKKYVNSYVAHVARVAYCA